MNREREHKILAASVHALALCVLMVWFAAATAQRASAIDVPTTITVSICGDAIVNGSEVCDDGAANNNAGYGSTTALRQCNSTCSGYGPYCGDGILQVRFTEQCDDGNGTSGDLCSNTCREETAVPPRSIGSPPRGSVPDVPGAPPGIIPSETLTKVILRGKAFPNSTVSILLDGKVLGRVLSDSNADFLFSAADVTPGTATFSFQAKDSKGVDSLMTSTIFEVVQSAVTTVANVFIPPTISLSSAQIAPGDPLTLSGQTVPGAKVNTVIDADTHGTLSSTADESGLWAFQLDTSSLKKGNHSGKAFFQLSSTEKSGFGKSLGFTVGNAPLSGGVSPDLNHDGKVNLVDFSIFLLSWNTDNAECDFNVDGAVNLADFSIMLFAWTG